MVELLILVSILFLAYLFFTKKKKRKSEKNAILSQVQPRIKRNEQIIQESLAIAEKSKNFETAKSRVELAEEKFEDIESIKGKYPFLEIENLSNLKYEIAETANNILNSWYEKMSLINQKGIKFEKEGKIDEAIKVYEKGVKIDTDTPNTYKRLAILYRKKKDSKNEIRVLEKATKITSNEWFTNRLDKLKNNLNP